jgi:hypothetical protein
MTKRGRKMVLAVFPIAGLAAYMVWQALAGLSSSADEPQYWRIRDGMATEEVVALMGAPKCTRPIAEEMWRNPVDEAGRPRKGWVATWEVSEGAVDIWFADGIVIMVVSPPPPSHAGPLLARLRERFRW